MDKIAKVITFVGNVQGVGFRFTALRVATRYDLTGYVKNLHDGSVEMLAQGYPEDINDCISDIQQSFPGYVRETNTQDCPLTQDCTDFKITF